MESVPDMDDLLDSLEDPPKTNGSTNGDSSSIDRPVRTRDVPLFISSKTTMKSTLVEESTSEVKRKLDDVSMSFDSDFMEENPKVKRLDSVQRSFGEPCSRDLWNTDSSRNKVQGKAENVEVERKIPKFVDNKTSSLDVGSSSHIPTISSTPASESVKNEIPNAPADSPSYIPSFSPSTPASESSKNETPNLGSESSGHIPSTSPSVPSPKEAIPSEDMTEQFEFTTTSLSESVKTPDETMRITFNAAKVTSEKAPDVFVGEKANDLFEDDSMKSDSPEIRSLEGTDSGKSETTKLEELSNDRIGVISVEAVPDEATVKEKVKFEEITEERNPETTVEVTEEDISSENQIIKESVEEEVSEEVSQTDRDTTVKVPEENISSDNQITKESVEEEVPEEVSQTDRDSTVEVSEKDISSENQIIKESVEEEVPEEVSQTDRDTTVEVSEDYVLTSNQITKESVEEKVPKEISQKTASEIPKEDISLDGQVTVESTEKEGLKEDISSDNQITKESVQEELQKEDILTSNQITKEFIKEESSKVDISPDSQITETSTEKEIPESRSEVVSPKTTSEIQNEDVFSNNQTSESIDKVSPESGTQNSELLSSINDPSKPVGFDSDSKPSEEEDLQLQKELESMEMESIPEDVVVAVTESANEPTGDREAQFSSENMQKSAVEIPQKPASVVLSTHDLSEFNYNPVLTESERQLGKTKPYWIPDEDCNSCMLCSLKFTVINRRHHCRCCGRVLCNSCCSVKRPLPYVEDPEKKQKVCEPCSRTLDRIEEFEKRQTEISSFDDSRTSEGRIRSDFHDNSVDFNEIGSSNSRQEILTRKKSVLKSKKTESSSEEPTADKKRSVKFLDGVHPGHETEANEAGPSRISGVEQRTDHSNENVKKISKRPISNRRFREKRIEEEQISLIKDDTLYLADCDAQLTKSSIDVVCEKLLNGEKLTFGIKKNYYVVSQLVQTLNGKVWCFSTRGMAAIGADELFFAFEAGEDEFKILEETIKEENKSEISDEEERKKCFIQSILYLFEYFFVESLIPANDNLDEKVGIRRCGSRMCKCYNVSSGEIGGIPTAVVLFHRPQGQDFSSFPIPFNVPFLVGTFILKQELIWAMTIPNRLLLRLGLQSSHFPIPIVNKRNRDPVYSDSSENSVLKVFNDFRNWTYRLPKIMGSTVEIEDGCVVKVYIPSFGIEELKQVIDSNRNMLAWSTELTDHPDSHLVAIQNMDNRTFRTEIFTDVGGTRQTIGANFVVIDGSLKNSTEKFLMTIIEDGVVLRFPSETMEEIVKNLQNKVPFIIDSNSMSVQIMFVDPYEPQSKTGALVSPIDEMYLLGHYQYGLTLGRQFRSQIPIPNTTEWALRLSTVINADKGRFPLQLQPRYFELCEQIGILIASTVEQFMRPLTLSEQRQICIRIRIEPESATYETAKWQGLDQEQYIWTEVLDDKLIPYLYQLCPMISSQLYIELYFSIISTRLLQNIDY